MRLRADRVTGREDVSSKSAGDESRFCCALHSHLFSAIGLRLPRTYVLAVTNIDKVSVVSLPKDWEQSVLLE